VTTDAAGWEQRYRDGVTPWDLGGPPPALLDALDGPPLAGGARRVLVPGAGFGHDALAFARAGHRVTAVDVAPSACGALRARAERAGLVVDVLEGDVLALPARLAGAFDVVWEQTCLCALASVQREVYVASMATALRPGGHFLGLFWHHGQPGGPPHDMPPDLVRTLFAPRFVELALQPVARSAAGRREHLLLARRP
jgi:SAM-dependent methyltransferase